jgi:hypothetical protein
MGTEFSSWAKIFEADADSAEGMKAELLAT